jgi:hypothetical protein
MGELLDTSAEHLLKMRELHQSVRQSVGHGVGGGSPAAS